MQTYDNDTKVEVTCKACGIIDILPIVNTSQHYLTVDSLDWYVCDEGCCVYCIGCARKKGFDVEFAARDR